MEQLIINGPTKLKGEIKVSGSKNAALPIIAATILVRGKVVLSNIPEIDDVIALLNILGSLGAKYTLENNTLTIDTKGIRKENPDPKLVRKLRASILLIGPLLRINKGVTIPHPGGCLIGTRPIDIHLEGFKKMGAKVIEDRNGYNLSIDSMKPIEFRADFTVTGTENLIMAAVLTEGATKISLAAAEPHVQDLCNFLNSAGAKIEGIGTHNLKIMGVEKLKEVEYEIIPDQIEAGTFAIAAAASKGDVVVNGFVPKHHESLLSKFDRAGIRYEILESDKVRILPTHEIRPFNLRTEIYPGFPTDLQAPMAVLATQANGTSEIYETIFEGRLGYINELSKMGANCIARDAHQATITGPTPLYGTRITSFDLRAGATLVIAGVIATGESRLDQIEIIDRGYEKIEEKLKALGANIKRVKLKEIEPREGS
ncbi:MAG: UDP-N-acetylglucosamine 1-carboxyvinyltransferase [Patescibacteria group bacterium]|nr:UDP-N-acetylglucosamine 1-carboxyvinyltransferase [Patescibacteria group bacterium]